MPRPRLSFPAIVLLAVAISAACKEEGGIKIKSLNFEGVEQVSKAALTNALQTKRGSRIPWGRKSYFDRRAFDADLKRIEAYYRDRGFPDARLGSFDIKLNDTQDEVDVTLRIVEGDPLIVTTVDLTGFDVLPANQLTSLREGLPLQPERPLDRQLALTARERATNVLRDHGYPYSEVAMTEQDEGPKRVRVLLAATPGPLAHFGEVEIQGQKTVGENVIRRQLTYKPGDVLTRTAMRESQRKLYGLELFEFVNVESQEDRETKPIEVATKVTVAETKHRKVTFGLGYGSEENARARIRWDHLNLLGGAQHAGFEAKWSSLNRGVRAEYTEPYFLRPNYSLRFEGQAWQASEPVYSLNQLGGRITLRRQANSQNFLTLGWINEYQRSSVTAEALEDFSLRDDFIALGLDPRTGESRGTLSALAFDVGRNTTTNLLDARSGYVLNGHLEQAGKWLRGSFDFWSVTAEARHYLPVGKSMVVANRIRFGSIDALGTDLESSVPFYRRFFIGGATSLRGWGRFEVSPLSGFGLPIGGHSMLEGSLEARLPVFGKLGAVAFVDYGNVWMGSWDIDLADLRYAVGPGLRYATPIGPARIDIGYQLTPEDNLRVNGEPEKRRWRLHFSIGQAF